MKTDRHSKTPLPSQILGIIKDIFHLFKKNILESIRLQLIITFLVCVLASFAVSVISQSLIGRFYEETKIDYSSGYEILDSQAKWITNQLRNVEYNRVSEAESIRESKQASQGSGNNDSTEQTPVDEATIKAAMDKNNQIALEEVQKLISEESGHNDTKIMVTDLNGKVLFHSVNAQEMQIDIHSMISSAMEIRTVPYYDENRQFTSFYPIDLFDTKSYVVMSGLPQARIIKEPGETPLPFMLALATFFLLFYVLTKRKMNYLEELTKGLMEISKGNLDHRVVIRGKDEFGSLAHYINYMTEQLKLKIDEERRAEKLKNELITNVSHDLRTPLTIIMGYLRLIKDKSYSEEQQADNYLNIAYSKSEGLKTLIEELFEYTKLTNEGIQLDTNPVCLNELLDQVTEEWVTYANDVKLELRREFPQEKLYAMIDSDRMMRVFDNLLGNALKYSNPQSIVQIKMQQMEGHALICVINETSSLSTDDLPHLFERFYRGEKSRSRETGGTGLGLAIAKNIIELHNGEIWVDIDGETAMFFVKLNLLQNLS